jgi:F-type H+-transporting ATPase subunit b
MEDAREVMTQERLKMMSQIKKDVSALSIEIAEKVLRKELSDKATQETFVSELVADAKLN